ncbi:hypothetical protein ZWY2020_055634 [Hordeum vulgare]|nr:hypothetical protein ZWY2020_055634 [Hordeum vulgare]
MLDAVVHSPPLSPPPAVVLLGHPQPVMVGGVGAASLPELLLLHDPSSSHGSSRLSSFFGSEVSSGSGVSVAAESQHPDAMDVFTPIGDLDAALRLAFVSIEPPNAFNNATSAVQAAMLRDFAHVSFDAVPWSVGVCYLHFASWADREEVIVNQPLEYEGARIDLFREELFGHVHQRARQCTLLVASCFPVEYISPVCIPVAFSGFGKVLEVDVG